MKKTAEDRIYRIVSEVCGVAVESIDDDTSPDTIPGWDSASHIHLSLALESEFEVELSPEDIMEMLSVRLIRMILKNRGVTISA